MNKFKKFTHLDNYGKVKMVNVSDKEQSFRTAEAVGYIVLNDEIIKKIIENKIQKGDVFAVAKIAGINAAKKNWELISLCHQIKLTSIDIGFDILDKEKKVEARSKVEGYDRTGVEMEALTAVSVSLLAIYDMCKALSKDMRIEGIELIRKTGGKSDYFKEKY
jgi:cyclic pyranopterin phosphate synthase